MDHHRLTPCLLGLLTLLSACHNEDFHLTAQPYGGSHIWGTGDHALVNGDATAARFDNPVNVAVGTDGTVYVADFNNDVVRAISTAGVVSTLVQAANFHRPFGMTVAGDGTLYVQTDDDDVPAHSATTGTIWRINTANGAATVVARDLGRPRGIAALADGRIALSDLTHQTISLLDPGTGGVTLLAGTADTTGFTNGTRTAASFNRPYGLAQAADTSLLVADQNNHAIRRVTLTGVVTTFSGAGPSAPGMQNGAVAVATFNFPEAVTISGSDIYIDDEGNHLIRRVTAGVVSTYAGDGTAGFVDATGTAAEFFVVEGIAASPDGTRLWIADGNGGNGDPYNRVRFLPIP